MTRPRKATGTQPERVTTEEYIRRLVAVAPPLTGEQRARLGRVFRTVIPPAEPPGSSADRAPTS